MKRIAEKLPGVFDDDLLRVEAVADVLEAAKAEGWILAPAPEGRPAERSGEEG